MSQEDPRHGNNNGLVDAEGEAPGGFKGKIRGFRIADLVMAVIVIWALAVKPYLDAEREDRREQAIAREHKVIAEAQEKMAVAFAEFSYIISMRQERREELNISMPQSLREKLYDSPRRTR